MSDYAKPNQRTGEQAKALADAATLVIEAQREAAARVRRAGADLLPEERDWFGDPCLGQLEPPPTPHLCGCGSYKGNGSEPCLNSFIDFTGPDFGTGSPRVTCGHHKGQHAEF